MKNNFQSKSVPRGTRTIWRYLSALFILFTFAIGNVWGATETVNKTKDNWTGTSCTLTHAECANGSADSKKDGDASAVTYIKFRTNKNSNTMTFNVVEGYKVTGFYLRAYTNDDSTPAVLTSIQYDADDAIVLNATLPKGTSKTEGTTYTYNNTISEATSSIVLQFNSSGKQILAVITITYEEASSCTAPTDPEIAGTADYTAGDDISLTASATGTDGSTTYTWYKGTNWATASAGSSIGSAATLTINDCAESDDDTYWCNISNGTGCEVQVSKAITVAPASCTDVVAPTGLAEDEEARTTEAITFTWTAADYASSYDVKLWDNAGCTGDPIASANVTTTSKEFTGLTDETTYYCKVQSKGDGETYCTNGGTTAAVSGTTKALPSYDVTVATSTGDDTRGTVSAAAASVKEGSTTTITAVPAPGYRVANWAVSGEGASISPSGSSNSKTTTLTMGSAKATVTVTFEEIPCPTSGVLYTMTMKSKSLSGVAQNKEIALAGDYATEEGGVSYLGNNNSDASKAQIKTEAGGIVYFNGNDAYLKVALDCPLQPGDFITIEGNASSTELKYLITNTNSRSSYVTSTNTTGTKKYYTVVADDILDGKSNVYFWREGSSGNKNIHSITITRPYAVTFESAHGTAPTTPTKALSFTLTELSDEDYDHTGWTADKAVKVGGETKAANTALAVDATVELTDNTTFTATWEAKAATFVVTYKANNGTSEADINDPEASTFAANTFTVPDGKMFAGWNTKADGEGTNYAVGDAVTEDITVYAKWVVDPTIRLIKNDGTLNTVNFITGATLKDDGPFTVDAVSYAKNVQFGNSCSGVSSIDNLNKAIIYHSATNATKVTIVAYDNYTGGSTANLYYAVVPEGTTSASATTRTMNKSTGDVYEVNMTGRSTIYIYCGHKEVRICQVLVEETGTANAVAPEVGYSVNLNKQRPFFASGEVTAFEGIEYKVSSNFKPLNGQVQIGTLTDTYYKFTIPTGQTRQLQLTTSNTSKYIVSQTLGDDTEEKKVSGNQTINLTAGTWYINPQGSNVNITNIAFAATPDPVVVTFKDGETTLGVQNLWSGDKATALDPAPTKTGYRFVKWQLSGADYDFDAAVTEDIQLDAVWQKTWKVTFNADNGETPAEVTVDNNTAVAAPDPAPTKAGNDFAGWYGKGESDAFDFNNTIDQDTTIVAHWTPLDNDASISALTYDGNDIDISSGVDFAYVLPYKASYVADKLEVTKSALSATVGEITYAAGVASFTVTAGDGVTTQDYTVTFTNGPKDMLTLIGTKVTGNNDHGPVYGYYAGSAAVKVASGSDYTYKLNKGNYIGVTLIDGQQFQAGDVAKIRVTDKQNATGFTLYTTNTEDSVLIMDTRTTTVIENGIHELVLPSYAGSQSLYLLRQNNNTTGNMNPCVDSIAVYRPYPVPVVNTITFNGAAGVVGESTITATIPYTTDIASLPIAATFLSNDPSLTTGAVGGPWVENEDVYTNTYVVTDKDEDTKTYTVTLTRAAVSHDASLTALEVEGYSLTPAFDPAILSYSVELPYGSAIGDLPTVTYTQAAAATAVKVDATELPGNTVITVTAEDESTEQEYKIRFTVNRTPTLSVFDGRTMDAAVVTFTDPTSGLSWTSEDASTSASSNTKTINGRTYTKSVKIFGSATSASRYLKFTVPADYVAKFYLAGSTNSSTGEATLFFSKELTADPAKAIAGLTASVDDPTWVQTELLLPGEYYFCVTGSARIYELSVQLYPIDYSRAINAGRYGTICLPNGGVIAGATIYEVAYYGATSKKIFFDEILGGVMEAGIPYIFLPKEGASQLAVTYTDEANVTAGSRNGLHGSYTQELLAKDAGNYILLNNQYLLVNSDDVYVGANRAYIRLEDITPTAPALAPGRRRISMGVTSENAAQGIEDLQGDNVQSTKVLINGNLYILRGEKVFDATGRLVK